MTALRWLTEHALRAAADPLVFERGVEYAADGVAELTSVDDTQVTATVYGSLPYDVELAATGATLRWSCTCPYAEDGELCKHVVAAGLTVLERHSRTQHPASDADATVTDETLRDWPTTHDRDELAAMLIDAASRAPDVRRDLELRAAAARGLVPDLAPYDGDLAVAFATGGFVEWGDMFAWASGVSAALDRLAALLDAGFADATVTLVEQAFAHLDGAHGHVDDSAGHLTHIAERLTDLHLAALAAADTDLAGAGERVLELALASDLGAVCDRLPVPTTTSSRPSPRWRRSTTMSAAATSSTPSSPASAPPTSAAET
jgi:hypothetical protein